MNFSAIKKRKLIITLILGVIISLMFFSIALFSVKAEDAGERVVGDINYGTSVNGAPFGSVQLLQDETYSINMEEVFSPSGSKELDMTDFRKDIYSYSNLAVHYKRAGVENKTFVCSSNVGLPAGNGITQSSLVYNVKAPAGTQFSYLKIAVKGRVDHYQGGPDDNDGMFNGIYYPQHGTGADKTCDNCFMKVYVSQTADFTDAMVKTYPAVAVGFTTRDMNLVELDPSLLGQTQCYIKIELSGSGDWVAVENISFTATDPSPRQSVSCNDSISLNLGTSVLEDWDHLAKAFKSSALKYQPGAGTGYDNNGVCSSGSDGYVVYKVKASEGKALSSLTLSCFGRVFHYAHDYQCSSNCRMEIWVSENEFFSADATTLVSTVWANDSGYPSARTFDLSEYVNGEDMVKNSTKELFVKIVLNGVGNWVTLEKVTFIGAECYYGYDIVDVNITDSTKDIVFDLDEEVTIKDITYTNVQSTSPVIVATVIDPDGNSIVLDTDTFTADKLGSYKIIYTLDDEGRIYTNSYTVFCVEDSSMSGLNTDDYIIERLEKEDDYAYVYRDNTIFNTATNYALAENTSFTNTDSDLARSKVKLEAKDLSVGKSATASLLLPIEVTTRLNTVVDLNRFDSGSKFIIAFTSNPGIPDLETMSDTGMYFVFSRGGSYKEKIIINGYFTGEDKDGNKVVGASMGAGDMVFAEKGVNGADAPLTLDTLGICLYRKVISDIDGSRDILDVYWNGLQTCYTANSFKPSSFINSDGSVYVTFYSEDTTTEDIMLRNVYEGDASGPVLSWTKDYFDEDGELIYDKQEHTYVFSDYFEEITDYLYINKEFVLPNFEFYDAKDGVLKLELIVTDPNGNEVEILEREVDGVIEKYVYINYEGTYVMEYSCTDYSANKTVDIRKFKPIYQDGAYYMEFSEEILSYGRQGRAIYIPNPEISVVDGDFYIDPTLEYEVTVEVVRPDGTTESVKPGSFYPAFDKGMYNIIYTVESFENGSEPIVTKAFYFVDVKVDVNELDTYQDAMDPSNWVSYDMVGLVGDVIGNVRFDDSVVADHIIETPNVESNEDGLLLFDAAYCTLPFKLYDPDNPEHNGLEISIDISRLRDKDEKDTWICFGFSSKPGPGSFYHVMTPGSVYIMFYYQGGEYWYTACYVKQDGTNGGLFTYSLGTTSTFTFGLDKITDSPSKTDNLNFYFNHVATAAGTETLIPYSEVVDNEDYIYINYWGMGAGSDPRTFKAALIKSFNICDQLAPEFEIEGGVEMLPDSFVLGSTVKLPSITVTDNLDKEFIYQIGLFAPNGKQIDMSREFVVDQEGKYFLVMKAMDNAGNSAQKVIEFKVVSSGCGSSFSADTLIPVATILSVASLACVVRIFKRKNEK